MGRLKGEIFGLALEGEGFRTGDGDLLTQVPYGKPLARLWFCLRRRDPSICLSLRGQGGHPRGGARNQGSRYSHH